MIRPDAIVAEDVRTAAPAIDLDHLRRYTMGNAGLEAEVLELFLAQVGTLARQLEAARERHVWMLAAHTLKGSARAVGARAIEALAAEAERMAPEARGEAEARRAALLGELAIAVRAAERFIAGA